MKAFYLFILGTLLISGCGNREIPKAQVQRGPENQLSIRINHAQTGQEADRDLVWQQGYQAAKDRFRQMDVMRRMARGRLAEIFGEAALKKDTEVRAVGLGLAARRNAKKIREDYPETYAFLVAFSQGVNEFIHHIEDVRPELLRWYHETTHNQSYRPADWEPEDSLASAVAVGFFLSNALQEKLTLGTLLIRGFGIGNISVFNDFIDFRPLENLFIMDQGKNPRGWEKFSVPKERNVNESFEGLALQADCKERGFPFSGCLRASSVGSNNWVVGQSFAGPGQTLLADDPHLPLTWPMGFYEVALDSTPAGGSFKVRGFNLPTLPLVMIGHNRDIAWGFTNLAADVDDVYIEVLDAKQESVSFKGKWVKMTCESESILVRTANGELRKEPFVLRHVGHHGPVFSDHFPELREGIEAIEEKKRVKVAASYRWVGLEGTPELHGLVGFNRASNFAEFKSAAHAYDSGSQNMVYSDRLGNIGYFGHGKFPVRPYANKQWPPYLPAIGTGDMEWDGYRKVIPELYNPPGDRIVTANNDPFGHTGGKLLYDFRDYFGYGFSTGIRAKRIDDLLQIIQGEAKSQRRWLGIADMARIQRDHKDLAALRFAALLETVAPRLKMSQAEASFTERLRGWDGEMDANRHEPILAANWYTQLKARFLRATADQLTGDTDGLLAFHQRILRDVGVKKKATDADIEDLLHKLNDAGGETIIAKTLYHRMTRTLSENGAAGARTVTLLGEALRGAAESVEGKEDLTWGQVNSLVFTSVLDGILPGIASFPMSRSGYLETVDVAWKGYGPTFRLVVQGSPEGFTAVASVPGGNFDFTEPGWTSELTRYRDGNPRPLVRFIE